ncbi:FAD-dependent monooxygenase [Nocardioides nitrophenolicus]|uniref:FAD-dependent monooxygenase n=1 Tax=Nocardioides nitrophenolicus TaxID=60489 RepID=UPI001958136F|nr:FAD-dependent monooxygenase [Nocardioides nitrophenolicus]MBM7519400.1 2-polyprenyl-6-methoxyphenol hydroxylase-like FAD-dependent oxidoreductase [Nocardioides nitrophenolicus]
MSEELVIAGAGIAGLALAAALRHAGSAWSCRLLDERPALGSTGGAITLWPQALAALDRIGIGAAVRAAGHPVGPGTVRTRSGRVLRTLDLPLLAVRRGVLVELLYAGLAPGSVTFGCAVTGYQRAGAGVRVQTSTRPLDAAALVGADGFRSRVARTLQPGLRERYAGYPAWRGLTTAPGLTAVQLWGERQELGVVPLGADLAYWFATAREPAGATGHGTAPDQLAHLARAFRDWPDPVARVLAATDPATVSRVDVLDRERLRRWTDGPVVVLGDAAHPMRPHLGQGGGQALVDAALLAGLLGVPGTPAGRPAAAFAAFERHRRRPTERVVRASRAASLLVDAPAVVHRLSALVPDRWVRRALRG